MNTKRTELNAGVFVNVPEMVDVCTRALERASLSRDEELQIAAQSVLSALVLSLGKRRSYIPEQLREHYNLLMRKI
jgi:hypothetical protein